MRQAVIFGTASFAEVARVYIDADSAYTVAAFTVHERYIREKTSLLGLPVVAFEQLRETHPPDQYEIFVALGFSKMNKARATILAEAKSLGYRPLTYISSQAQHVGHFEVGENSFIFEGNVIQPFVKIGNNTVLWSGNHVGHHTVIGDNCFIASHVVISGNCTIADNCFLGVNSTLRDGVTVARECIIGAGALILKDTIERGIYNVKGTEPAELTSDRLRTF